MSRDNEAPKKPGDGGRVVIPGVYGLEKLSQRATEFVSSPWGALTLLGLLAAWLIVIPSVGWSKTYDAVDEFITLASFFLLFLIQRSQSKDTKSLQIKLNELLAAAHRASPGLINVEDRTEAEVSALHQQYQEVQQRGQGSHSIDDICPAIYKPGQGSSGQEVPEEGPSQ